MEYAEKIFVAGHKGLVGSAIVNRLRELGYREILVRSRAELDLRDRTRVQDFLLSERPQYVFLAAAKVGGIMANQEQPADFILENLLIEAAVLQASWEVGVQRLLFLGSSCIYPKLSPQPIKEEYLLGGPLEPTNRPYAVAKIAGVEMCWALNRQHQTRFLAAMPTNLYGPGDNYHPTESHVIPGLIRRFHEAKDRGAKSVTVWGTGTARREFLTNRDAADACIFLMNLSAVRFDSLTVAPDHPPLINIGYGEDLTVRELAELVASVVGFEGRIEFDHSRPDGTPRKLLDSSRLRNLGWTPKVDLMAGIKSSYQDFLQRGSDIRPEVTCKA